MVQGQLSGFSLAHGSRTDFSATDATRINTGSSDEPEFPLGQGPRQNSAFSMGFKLETSATEVVKQQLVLVMKSTLYRDAAYCINNGTHRWWGQQRCRRILHIRMSEHLCVSSFVGKFSWPYIILSPKQHWVRGTKVANKHNAIAISYTHGLNPLRASICLCNVYI